MNPDEEAIARCLLSLLADRPETASICPSEVARALSPADESSWRERMPQVRSVAADLARRERIRVTRGQATLDPDRLEGGPIRLRRGIRFDPS